MLKRFFFLFFTLPIPFAYANNASHNAAPFLEKTSDISLILNKNASCCDEPSRECQNFRGPPGPIGPTGATGATRAQGPTGPTGPTPTGPMEKERKKGVSRKQNQLKQKYCEMIEELPKGCDIGVKQGATGYRQVWKGYKLHTAVDDNCIPIANILSSASLNDSEVAIPLAEKSNQPVVNLYDLMDSA